MSATGQTSTYPVDVTITTYRRMWIVARSSDEAGATAQRIVDQLNDEGRSRLPHSPAAPDDTVTLSEAGDPVQGTTDPFATYAYWTRIAADA